MRSVSVVGTGLIGASIGIGLSVAGWEVCGWDPNSDHLAQAASVGALSKQAKSLEEAVDGPDLVILASPPRATISILSELRTDALVTDVAGIKQPVVAAASGLPRFVGGHPMAGREVSGPLGASGGLFRGATWVITTDGASPSDIRTVSGVARTLEALPVEMTAPHHDRVVALVSHLPMVLAAYLVNRLSREGAAAALVAGGFRDLTRIALSNSDWWADLLVSNRMSLSSVLREMSTGLEDWARHLDEVEERRVGELLDSARQVRAAFAPPGEGLGVLLEDRPGEIARVGHALSESGVDLRDLQLRHATHGGGGVLTLSVRPEESDRLRRALRAEGFRLLGD